MRPRRSSLEDTDDHAAYKLRAFQRADGDKQCAYYIPRTVNIFSSCDKSDCSPGKMANRCSSSAWMHPTAHMSTPTPYTLAPISSSGARYQSVTTCQEEWQEETWMRRRVKWRRILWSEAKYGSCVAQEREDKTVSRLGRCVEFFRQSKTRQDGHYLEVKHTLACAHVCQERYACGHGEERK
jgi:hypothetical protein